MGLKKIIVDCDTGTDDAVALIILIAAHKKQQIEIKGITCVRGNTDVDNVVRNVFRILDICGTLDVSIIYISAIKFLKKWIAKTKNTDSQSFPKWIFKHFHNWTFWKKFNVSSWIHANVIFIVFELKIKLSSFFGRGTIRNINNKNWTSIFWKWENKSEKIAVLT